MSPAAYPASAGEVIGVDNSSGFNLDRPTALQGQLFGTDSTNQFAASPGAAEAFGFHVGEVVEFAVHTNAQTSSHSFGTSALAPYRRFKARLVGIVIQNPAVVQDDTDASSNAILLAIPPRLTAPLLAKCAYYSGVSVKVDDSSRHDSVVQREIAAVLPPGFSAFQAAQASDIEAKAERTIRPESIALGVFGGIAALSSLLIGAQLIGRRKQLDRPDLAKLRAFRTTRPMGLGADLLGDLGAILLGTVLAVGVAVALSPLAPLGPTRRVYPTPGVAVDWSVVTTGFAVIVLGLSLIAIGLSYRVLPHRNTSHQARMRGADSVATGFARSIGCLPQP